MLKTMRAMQMDRSAARGAVLGGVIVAAAVHSAGAVLADTAFSGA